MNQNDEFLLSKINELERKIFELEKRVKTLEDEKMTASSIGPNETPSDENKTNTRTERYSFDGEMYKKNRLVLAVVSKYIETHHGITSDELAKAFPAREFKSSYACVMDISLIPEKQIKPVKRYFVDEPITLADGTKVAVCTQWGNNTKLFIDYVRNKYGYVIEPATL